EADAVAAVAAECCGIVFVEDIKRRQADVGGCRGCGGGGCGCGPCGGCGWVWACGGCVACAGCAWCYSAGKCFSTRARASASVSSVFGQRLWVVLQDPPSQPRAKSWFAFGGALASFGGRSSRFRIGELTLCRSL